MNDIEQKALALVNEVARELGWGETKEIFSAGYTRNEALCRAIEQHEATKQELEATKQELSDFRQEVSDEIQSQPPAVRDYLGHFIIPAPKPDPLVEVLHEVDTGPEWDSPEDYCNKIRAALEARGLEIREKGQ